VKARFLASAAVAAAVVLGTSACNLVAPQATTLQYNASDGVSGDVGSIAIRNAVVISDNGSDGNLVFTAVNDGGPHMLRVQYGDDQSVEVMVDANASVLFGGDTTDAVLLEDIGVQPGGLLNVYFQYGQEPGLELPVPVLNGDLREYSTLVPTDSEAAD